MIIYILLFFYEMIACATYDKNKRSSNQRIMFVFIFLPLWLVMGLRWGGGKDYFTYEEIFNNVGNGSFHGSLEIGYYYLNLFLYKLTHNPQSIFLVSSYVITFLHLKSIIKYCDNICIVVLAFLGLGYYFHSMNAIRQFMAISIAFAALEYLESKQFLKYLTYILIAALFHKSVLIWLPVYFMVNYIKGKKYYIITGTSFILINLFSEKVLNILNKYGIYSFYIQIKSKFLEGRISIPNLIFSGTILLCSFLLYNNLISKRRINVIRIRIAWIHFHIYAALYVFGIFSTRIAFHFSIVQLLLITDIIQSFKMSSRVILKLITAVILFVLMLITLYISVSTGNDFIPYRLRPKT